MILKVGSTDDRFRTVEFGPGLNIVLAKRASGASNKASTNATGKTALIEIIHFCLGGELSSLKTLAKIKLKDHAFFMEFTVGERVIGVQRSISQNRVVKVRGLLESEKTRASIKGEIEDAVTMGLEDWKAQLGTWFFDTGRFGNTATPSFRALIAYFIRYPETAYLTAKSTVPKEKDSEAERKYAYLLHLNWQLVDSASALRTEGDKLGQDESGFRQLARKLGAEGDSESELAADLDFKKSDAERAAEEARMSIQRFRVLPEYEQEERRANSLATQMQGLRRDLLVRSRVLEDYRASAKEADDIAPQAVLDLYESAGVEIPDSIKRTLDEVVEFHKSLVIDRQAFLSAEITRLYREENDLRLRLTQLDEEKSSILRRLQGSKALSEYNEFSNRANELQSKANQLRDAKSIYNDLIKRKSDLTFKRADIVGRFTTYNLENSEHYETLVGLYSEMSSELHETTAQLVVRTDFPKRQGLPRFFVEVKIDGKGATGRVRCEILLFDLLLARLWSANRPSTTILIHDSVMYDSMDPRQRAHSLALAKQASEKLDFQYLVMLNESEFPEGDLNEIEPETDFRSFISHVVDDSPSGGLFGFRFDDTRYLESPDTADSIDSEENLFTSNAES